MKFELIQISTFHEHRAVASVLRFDDCYVMIGSKFSLSFLFNSK